MSVILNNSGIITETMGTSVASASSIDIWTNGSIIPVSGTATITSFANAPQAGVRRSILATGAFSLTASANLIVLGTASGNTVTVAAGDLLDVYAKSTTEFIVNNNSSNITENGSNSSGYYIKYKNGTLIQWKDVFTTLSVTSGYAEGYYATYTWWFPVAFTDATYFSSCISQPWSRSHLCGIFEDTTTYSSFYITDYSSANTTDTWLQLYTIGRWY